MRVKVYYSEHCGPCHACMDWLKEQGVEFEAILAREAKQNDPNLEIYSVPTIEVDGKFIIGFDRAKLKEVLGL